MPRVRRVWRGARDVRKERGVSGTSEVRLVPVSREQRDWHAKQAASLRDQAEWFATHLDGDAAIAVSREADAHEALVAAWDAAVPGVVDSSWAAQVRDLLVKVKEHAEYGPDSAGVCPRCVELLGRALDIAARAAAAGERPSVSLRETRYRSEIVRAARMLDAAGRTESARSLRDFLVALPEQGERPLREAIETHPQTLGFRHTQTTGRRGGKYYDAFIVEIEREAEKGGS